jgi:hypothetical protein
VVGTEEDLYLPLELYLWQHKEASEAEKYLSLFFLFQKEDDEDDDKETSGRDANATDDK